MSNSLPTFAIVLAKVQGAETPRDTILRHVEHLRSLDEGGQLVLCGPFSDHPSGMVVVKARDLAEATTIARKDPFVREGVRTFEVRTWLIANRENNYLA
jgi:uncharacterized protein YciI